MGHAADGNHGKAAILNLSHSTPVALEAEGVEAKVAGAVDGSVREAEEEGDLEQADKPQDLPHCARLDGSLMQAPHLLALVPLVHEWKGVQVLDDLSRGWNMFR